MCGHVHRRTGPTFMSVSALYAFVCAVFDVAVDAIDRVK